MFDRDDIQKAVYAAIKITIEQLSELDSTIKEVIDELEESGELDPFINDVQDIVENGDDSGY